jgi:hypothetical protein
MATEDGLTAAPVSVDELFAVQLRGEAVMQFK